MKKPETKSFSSKFMKADRLRLIVVALVFAGLGSVFLLRSFAANPNLPGDVNNDNIVNITDLSLLLSAYGKTTNLAADMNGDGKVNITDLSILLSNYGKTYGTNPPTPPPTTPPPTTPPPTTPPPSTGYKPGFLYRQGRNFMLDGKVHKAAAVNNFALTGCHHGFAPSQSDMDGYFSKMKPGAMVRTWAFNESDDTLIDRAIKTAEKYNVKLVLALADGAEYCGSPDFDGGWYSSGFKGAYFSWVASVTSKYKDSPAVGAWEIMNEPALGADGVSQSTIKSFFAQTAAHIKANDPNHMVSTGTLAPWMSEHQGAAGYADVHNSPNIDIVSLHEYDYAYQNSRALISPHFGPTKQAAEQLQKPIIVGEAGVTLASGCMTQQERANAFKQKVDAYLSQGASAVFFWGITWPPNEDTVCDEEHGSNDPINGAVQNMVNGYTPTY